MARSMLALGKATICMGMALLPGQTVENMKVNTNMIRNMDKVSTPGLMAGSITEAGKLGNNMALELIRTLKRSSAEESGMVVRGCFGVMLMGMLFLKSRMLLNSLKFLTVALLVIHGAEIHRHRTLDIF